MKIVHMSDLHLTKGGQPIWGVNTIDHFNKSIEIIREMKNIDAIIVTGDISDDGSVWAYQYADKMFSSLKIPTLCCSGNHDSLQMMLNDYRPLFYQILPPSYLIHGWKILIVNSVIPDDEDSLHNKSRGFLSEESMIYIKRELNEGLPTIISFHHPAQEPGGWLNRRLLDNRDEFNKMLINYPNTRLVLYGHIHFFTDVQKGHIRYSSSSSVGFAFNKELPKFQIADGQEGFSLIDIKNNEIKITNILLTAN